MRASSKVLLGLLLTLIVGALALRYGRGLWMPIYRQMAGQRGVSDAVAEYGPAAEARMTKRFRDAGASYPPEEVTLVVLKDERRLELWARRAPAWLHVHTYDVLAASGEAGPKLREGDRQVPEGVYRIEGLNPNSSFHLSLKLNYPNEFDREQAARDGRTQLGGDIFLHGKDVSIGCIAIGDRAIEDLFVLAARMGRENIRVIVAPNDLRKKSSPTRTTVTPAWVSNLYSRLKSEMELLGSSGAGSHAPEADPSLTPGPAQGGP